MCDACEPMPVATNALLWIHEFLLRKGCATPRFTILSRVDAYVDYTCTVAARSSEEAVDLVYEGLVEVGWTPQGVVEFDNTRMSAIDNDGDDIGGYSRGKG